MKRTWKMHFQPLACILCIKESFGFPYPNLVFSKQCQSLSAQLFREQIARLALNQCQLSFHIMVIRLVSRYLVLDPQWYGGRGRSGDRGSGSCQCGRPNNSTTNQPALTVGGQMNFRCFPQWSLESPWITKLWCITLWGDRGQLKGRWDAAAINKNIIHLW